MRSFVISLPDNIGAEFDKAGALLNCTSLEVLQKFIKFGLIALNIEQDPNARLLIEDQNGQREITLISEQ